MASSNVAEEILFTKRRGALVNALLTELAELGLCEFAAFGDFGENRDFIQTFARKNPLPEIDWRSLLSLLYRAQESEPGVAVIGREAVVQGPRLGALAEHFENGVFDVVVSMPVMEDDALLGVACLFGKVPPANPKALRKELRSPLEALVSVAASALASLASPIYGTAEHGIHSEAVRGLPDGILIADSSGKVLEANEAFVQLVGVPAESLIGRDVRSIPILGGETGTLIEALLNKGEAFEVVGSFDRPETDEESTLDGELVSLEGTYVRLRGITYSSGENPRSGIILLADDATRTVLAKREADIREHRHKREIELAKHLQEDFFPETYQKKRIRIATRLIAAHELAGDFFDVFNLGPNTIGLVIGDVVGRGIPGSLMAMSMHGMIVNQVGALTPPMKVLERVNDALFHQVKGDYWYGTCFYAKIHVTQLRVTYARAGHELPLWYHYDTGEVTTLEGEGLPLGIFPDSSYTTSQIFVSEGDKLLLYTDGLTDTVNPAGERFGHDRLVELFKTHSNLGARNLLKLIENTVEDFRAGREQLDDIAIALISVVPDSWTTVTIPPFSFHEVIEDLLTELDLKGVDEDTQFKVRLSLDECVTNAYRHGHKCDERRTINVGYIVKSDHVVMKVKDCGEGFDFGLIPDPTLEENLMLPGGRGVFLTLKLMDKIEFNDVGNEITLTKSLHGNINNR